jgi:hypothetical protein
MPGGGSKHKLRNESMNPRRKSADGVLFRYWEIQPYTSSTGLPRCSTAKQNEAGFAPQEKVSYVPFLL